MTTNFEFRVHQRGVSFAKIHLIVAGRPDTVDGGHRGRELERVPRAARLRDGRSDKASRTNIRRDQCIAILKTAKILQVGNLTRYFLKLHIVCDPPRYAHEPKLDFPLHLAGRRKDNEMVKLFIEAGAAVDAKNVRRPKDN